MFAFGGSSITANANTWAFRQQAQTTILQNFPAYDPAFYNASASGWATWPNLVNLSADVLANAPNVVILDTVNDDGSAMDNATVEAYIRRVWAANPATRILLWNFFTVSDPNVDANVNSPTNQAGINATEALAAHYSIPLLDYWGTIQQRVNSEGHHLNEYMADTVHPNQAGHAEAFALLSPQLLSGGGAQPQPLPARLYDNGDYENTPTIKLGTDYDSRTGVWTDTLTRTESSQVGATITYSATCQSFGAFRADGGTNNVEVSIDGGAYAAMSFYQNGTPIGAGRAAHTIAVKVVSGTVRIDEFWAI